MAVRGEAVPGKAHVEILNLAEPVGDAVSGAGDASV
jgi:hypothetical protein